MVGPWQVWHRPGLCPQLTAWTPAAERPAPLPPSVWSEAIQPPGRCVPPHRLGAERATPPRGRDDGWRPSPRPRTPPGPSTEEGLGAAAGRLVSMLRQPRPGSSEVLPTPPAAPFPGVSPQPRPVARPRGQLSPGPAPARLCCAPAALAVPGPLGDDALRGRGGRACDRAGRLRELRAAGLQGRPRAG